MKFSIYWILFTFIPIISFSQNSLSGQIIDASDKSPLSFVNIYFPQLEKGTSSADDGKFYLEDLPAGSYKIIVSIIGYQTFSKSIQLPNESELLIELTPSAIEMEQVILSTPFHKLQRENVMKVEQLMVNELRNKGMVTLSNSISEIAGVSSISTGVSIGKPVIRGLSSNRVLVYAQGVRLENQQFGDEHGLGLSDSGIESIEVIKGPASLLYGSDALGGVLYLNPERFAAQDSTLVDFGGRYFSNTQGFSTNLGVKSSGNKFKFLLRGSLAEHADYKTNRYRVTNSRFKEHDIKIGLGYSVAKFKTDLRYNFNNAQLGLPEEIGIQNTDRDPLLPNQEIGNHILSSKSSWFFDKGSMDLNLGYIHNNRKEFEEPEEAEPVEEGPALHMKLNTFNYDLKYTLPKSERFETIVGIQGMFQENKNFGEEQLIPDANIRDFGLLATSHLHFDMLDLQLGLRFDNRNIDVTNDFNNTYNSFNIASGLRYDLGKKMIARINLATGFRAPNLAELASDGVHEGTNRYEIGNPDLKTERNFQSDLAVEYKSEHFEFVINGFYNLLSNYIFISPNGDFVETNAVYVYLQDDARLYGGEIGLHYHPHPLDWLHIESSFDMVKAEQDNGDALPLIPANRLRNTLRFEFNTDWVKEASGFITLSHAFDQNDPSTFETRTTGYSLLSAGVSGQLKLFNKPLMISVTGTNLTDKFYVNHLSRLKGDGIANIGRNISFGLTYSL
ncbi:MAG: TonB-dependent receptor [Flavobacteriaceae bacterium]|nr:TonB-dependent receptor [Bacteroidia bacterium]NNF75402.1 TonB-dependent receptor [Flavobacteriaceae bacterium]